MSLYSDLNEVLTPYAQRIKRLAAANDEVKADLMLEKKGSIEVTDASIIQGSYNSSGDPTSNSTRIRVAGFIPVYNGLKIRFTAGANAQQMFYGKFDANRIFVADGRWLNSGILDVDWDGYTILLYRKTNNADITPSEYDATTTLLSSERDNFDNINRNLSVIAYGVNKTFTVERSGYYNLQCLLLKDSTYTYTNNTSSGTNLLLLKSDGTTKTISGQVLAGKSLAFTVDGNDYVGIRFYANETGSISIKGGYSLTNPRDDRVAIVLLDGKHPFRKNVYSASIIFPGTKLYVIAKGTKTTVTYEDVVSQIPNNAVVDARGLVVTLPSEGAFGYNIENKVFEVINNYAYSGSFVPLANRYYAIMWGTLIDDADLNGLIVSQHNEKAFVYTSGTVRHSYATYGNNGGVKLHVGGILNLRLINSNRGIYTNSLNWSAISSDITDYITIDGSSADIVIPDYSMSLVFNVQDGLLHLRRYSSQDNVFNQYEIILFSIAYGTPIKGILYDEYINRLVEDMHEDGGANTNELRSQTFTTPYHVGATDFATKCQEFSSLLLGDTMNGVTAPTDFESFLFFTDPHLLEGSSSGWEQRCYEFMSQIQKYYNSTPTTFCLCGGDWLGNSDLPAQSCFKMGYINGFMESMFKESYLLVGNHDTNYQGKKDSESATYTTKLSVQSIVDLWYRKEKKAYYKFDGARTTFYCFDTGTENQSLVQNDGYQMSQAEWFAESLLSDNSDHIALALHIIYYNYNAENLENGIQPLTLLLSQISNAYNNRSTISVNGTTYNYGTSTGKVEFMIGGHYHQDVIGTMNGIPWIITTNVRHDEVLGASFDLVLADYGNRIIRCIRVGSGENRTVNLT